MMKKCKSFLKASLTLLLVLIATNSFSNNWINPAGGNFSDPANWDLGVPGVTDSVHFNLSSTGYNVSISGSRQTNAFYLANDNVTLRLDPGAEYTLSGPVRSLYVARNAGDIGVLNIKGGSLVTLASGALHDGIAIADSADSTGTLTIDGASLQASGDLEVGFVGDGTFNLINNSLAVTNGEVLIGYWPDSTGTVLVNAATWNHTGDFRVGSPYGQGDMSILNGGTVTATGLVSIGNAVQSTVNVTGINSTLDSGNFLSVGGSSIGNLNISQGGAVFCRANFITGYFAAGTGNVNISGIGSQLYLDGGNNYFGSKGASNVTVSNGGLLYSKGHANIGTTFLDVSTSGVSNVTITGAGSRFVAGTAEPTGYWGLYIGDSSKPSTLAILDGANVDAAFAMIFEAGILNIDSGTFTAYNNYRPFDITKVLHNSGSIILNNGLLNADVTNNNNIDVSGAGTSTINGDLTNNGTVKTTATILVITGTFTNNGAYLSDPAENIFADIIVDADGYLVGGEGDRFIVNGAFTNNSTQSASWNTDYAALVFDGAGVHDVTLGSEDFGVDGVADNFNWGVLRLESGVGLNLLDSDGGGAAIYVGLIDLADGASQLTLINSPFNIYYDESLAGNAYLSGQDFALAGGGMLTPGTFPAVLPPLPDLWLQITGISEGGAVFFSVAGVALSVITTSGLTPEQVAQAIADAINNNAILSAMGSSATVVGDTIYIKGSLTDVSTTDAGLFITQGLGTAPPADGDINLDGVVNVADVLLGMQSLSGVTTLTSSQLLHGDVAPLVSGIPAPDGFFTLGDLLVIQRKALGQINF